MCEAFWLERDGAGGKEEGGKLRLFVREIGTGTGIGIGKDTRGGRLGGVFFYFLENGTKTAKAKEKEKRKRCGRVFGNK